MARTVVLLLVVLCTVSRTLGRLKDSPLPHQTWPCPDPDAISPCICTEDADRNLNMDCSAVLSTNQLLNAFQAPFPYKDFVNLYITPSDPPHALDTIPSGAFGDVSFQHIRITGTRVTKIEEEAFHKSRETLLSLDLSNNRIDDFPFMTLPEYIFLWYLDLAGNDLPALPDLSSVSIRALYLERNLGLTVDETTFVHVKLLEVLNLQDMNLGNIPPNVFSRISLLRALNLDNNGYEGVLAQDTLKVPLDSLEILHLKGNAITNIHPEAITGLTRSATIDFRDNNIKLLDESNWRSLLDQVTLDNAIDLRDNNLLCGCEVFWLVRDESLMRKIHKETRCSGNDFPLHDLPLDIFVEMC